MERLTIDEVIAHCERTTKNTELIMQKIPDDNKYYWEHKQTAEWLRELKRYKDLEEKCIKENSFSLRALLEKWNAFCDDIAQWLEWRNLKESGRLVILPCEVGDYIYDISEFTDGNEHPEMIVVRAYYIELSLDADGEINYCIAGYDYKKEDFGKTVFHTIEEAEAALKGEKNGD